VACCRRCDTSYAALPMFAAFATTGPTAFCLCVCFALSTLPWPPVCCFHLSQLTVILSRAQCYCCCCCLLRASKSNVAWCQALLCIYTCLHLSSSHVHCIKQSWFQVSVLGRDGQLLIILLPPRVSGPVARPSALLCLCVCLHI